MSSAIASWLAAVASPAMDDAQFSRWAQRTRMRKAGKVNCQAGANAGTHE